MNPIILKKERLVECRKKKGLSKREASKRMNMSQPAYLRYESGERQPSIHVVKTMAEILSTSVDYLLGLSDDNRQDSYYIKESDDPELFEIVQNYKTNDRTRERLIAYYNRLKKS